jgi:hypothetical protein
MKKNPKATNIMEDIRPEYDFSKGVRGKYAKALRKNGYTIRVCHSDGTFTEKRVLGENAVLLEPDVSEYFPNSKSVNRALRTLISILPEKRKIGIRRGSIVGRKKPKEGQDGQSLKRDTAESRRAP